MQLRARYEDTPAYAEMMPALALCVCFFRIIKRHRKAGDAMMFTMRAMLLVFITRDDAHAMMLTPCFRLPQITLLRRYFTLYYLRRCRGRCTWLCFSLKIAAVCLRERRATTPLFRLLLRPLYAAHIAHAARLSTPCRAPELLPPLRRLAQRMPRIACRYALCSTAPLRVTRAPPCRYATAAHVLCRRLMRRYYEHADVPLAIDIIFTDIAFAVC